MCCSLCTSGDAHSKMTFSAYMKVPKETEALASVIRAHSLSVCSWEFLKLFMVTSAPFWSLWVPVFWCGGAPMSRCTQAWIMSARLTRRSWEPGLRSEFLLEAPMLVSGQAVPQQRWPWGFIYSITIKNVLFVVKKKKLCYFRVLLKMGGVQFSFKEEWL